MIRAENVSARCPMRPSVELNIKPDREPHKKMQSVVSPPDRPIACFKFKSRQRAILAYMHLNYISTHQGSFLQLTSKPDTLWHKPHHCAAKLLSYNNQKVECCLHIQVASTIGRPTLCLELTSSKATKYNWWGSQWI